MIQVNQTYRAPVHFVNGREYLKIRELSGKDEQLVTGTSTADAIALLQQLLEPDGQSEFPAEHLVATDRDVILSVVYEQTFGTDIQGTMVCPDCGDFYDYDFRVRDVREQILAGREPADIRFNGEAVYLQADAGEFRLLNGGDELDIRGMDTEQANRLLMERSCPDYPAQDVDIDSIFAHVTPILRADMASSCPECGSEHTMQFDMQFYLLTKLLQEQQYLSYEIHRLASAYHWSMAEILDLPRRLRKRYVTLIEKDFEGGLT